MTGHSSSGMIECMLVSVEGGGAEPSLIPSFNYNRREYTQDLALYGEGWRCMLLHEYASLFRGNTSKSLTWSMAPWMFIHRLWKSEILAQVQRYQSSSRYGVCTEIAWIIEQINPRFPPCLIRQDIGDYSLNIPSNIYWNGSSRKALFKRDIILLVAGTYLGLSLFRRRDGTRSWPLWTYADIPPFYRPHVIIQRWGA